MDVISSQVWSPQNEIHSLIKDTDTDTSCSLLHCEVMEKGLFMNWEMPSPETESIGTLILHLLPFKK